jgi:hypothetical protein
MIKCLKVVFVSLKSAAVLEWKRTRRRPKHVAVVGEQRVWSWVRLLVFSFVKIEVDVIDRAWSGFICLGIRTNHVLL